METKHKVRVRAQLLWSSAVRRRLNRRRDLSDFTCCLLLQVAGTCGEDKEKCREAAEGLEHPLSPTFAVSTQV